MQEGGGLEPSLKVLDIINFIFIGILTWYKKLCDIRIIYKVPCFYTSSADGPGATFFTALFACTFR